jgi:hypothetical protein
MITVELLRQRIAELNKLRSEHLDVVLRIEGAIDNCNDLIKMIEGEGEKPSPEAEAHDHSTPA